MGTAPKRIDAETRQMIRNMIGDKWSDRFIARSLGVNRGTVVKLRKEMGIEAVQKPFGNTEKIMARSLYVEGRSITEIAAVLRRNRSTIYRFIKSI